jgi:hypothetical protein
MEQQGRIIANNYPADWQYYTFSHPAFQYLHFAWSELVEEKNQFHDLFYSYPRILGRALRMALYTRNPTTVRAGKTPSIHSTSSVPRTSRLLGWLRFRNGWTLWPVRLSPKRSA